MFLIACLTPKSPRISERYHVSFVKRNVSLDWLTLSASQNCVELVSPGIVSVLSSYKTVQVGALKPCFKRLDLGYIPVKHLYCLSHSSLCQSSTSKYLHRFISNFMCRPRSEHLLKMRTLNYFRGTLNSLWEDQSDLQDESTAACKAWESSGKWCFLTTLDLLRSEQSSLRAYHWLAPSIVLFGREDLTFDGSLAAQQASFQRRVSDYSISCTLPLRVGTFE